VLNWGLHPYLGAGPFVLPAYSVMVALAFGAGLALHRLLEGGRRRPGTGWLLAAGLLGGLLGAKLPYLPANIAALLHGERNLEAAFAGRTILGGLLGGAIAVRLAKARLGITERRGDALVPALALGMAIGRMGCLLRGCCVGRPTDLPWGLDFGDGIHRHPTQAFEMAFDLLWLGLSLAAPRGERGRLFDAFTGSYFAFRFLLEFIRTEAPGPLGLTPYQWACLAGLAWVLWKARRTTLEPTPRTAP